MSYATGERHDPDRWADSTRVRSAGWSAGKRVIDLALAGVGLGMTAPLIGALAIAIKLDTRGPMLFVQTRVGRGGRPIRVLKLRSMVHGAESLGPGVTAARDPRITRIGLLLRRSKLDELPQLWNVLSGDMSIVGPRPELPRYVELYRPEWRAILDVRPGITDTASLTFRDEETLLSRAIDRERAYREVLLPLKARLALADVRRSSMRHDLSILIRTIRAIVGGAEPDSEELVLEAMHHIDQLNEERT